MKLYFIPGACSLAPHIVLRELGAKFDLEQVDPSTKKTTSGADFLAINPKGSVPAVALDDGEVLTEGPVILQYLADKAGAVTLAPAAGSKQRLKVQEWLNYISSELHKGLSPLFRKDTPDAYRTIIHTKLAKQCAYLDKILAGQTYLTGDTFTIADAYLFTIMNWRNFLGFEVKQHTALQAYLDRIAARPKVREAMTAEGLLKAA